MAIASDIVLQNRRFNQVFDMILFDNADGQINWRDRSLDNANENRQDGQENDEQRQRS